MGKKRGALIPADCLIVFAKEPVLGRVKTRLGPFLSPPQCLDLYKAFLKDTGAIVRQVDLPLKILAHHSFGRWPWYLKKIFPKFYFYRQQGNDLGERMHNAFQRAARKGARKSVIVGSDSPTLPAKYIQEAFTALAKNDVALGPAYDGGYYLIGLKTPCPELFERISWSSRRVLKQTCRNAQKLKKRVYLLKQWGDIDDFQSLESLRKGLEQNHKGQAFWTKRFLKSNAKIFSKH